MFNVGACLSAVGQLFESGTHTATSLYVGLNRLTKLEYYQSYRPGDKRQLKAQDVTAKLVRFDILRMVPKNNLFCIKST